MSKIFTKLLFVVAFLLGAISSTMAGKYTATMTFGGIASGTSDSVSAEISENSANGYDLSFKGFDVNIIMLGNQPSASATITNLSGSEDALVMTPDSKLELAGEKLPITKFSYENEIGSFEASYKGMFTVSCEFKMEKVVVSDTIVKKTIELEDVPFYNLVVDMNKEGDTIRTNNDSTSVGIKLYEKRAALTLPDFEIKAAGLSLKQNALFDDLVYAQGEDGTISISGNTLLDVKQFGAVPAVVKCDVKDGQIDGTIVISANLVVYNYEITITFGKNAEGVVIEEKQLEYTKTDKFFVNSDETFALDSFIYINEDGILIEHISYSIVAQEMTLLIKDYDKAVAKTIMVPEGMSVPVTYLADKAEAYISVGDNVNYLKDVDINLMISVVDGKAFGQLTILEGGSETNEFIDMLPPFQSPIVGPILNVAVDTATSLHVDNVEEDLFFPGIYDFADGEIKTVKIVDPVAFRELATENLKAGEHRMSATVVAVDKAGNSAEFQVMAYVNAAEVRTTWDNVSIDSMIVTADSITHTAQVNILIDPIVIYATNDSLGISMPIETVMPTFIMDTLVMQFPVSLTLAVGEYPFRVEWGDPFDRRVISVSSYIKVVDVVSDQSNNAVVNADKTLSVSYKNGNLFVDGAENATVSIYSLSGANVYTGKAGAVKLHNGIYIVKVNDKALKLVVK
ncbi:MAG: hypothetical protein MJZ00_02490 [Paludibacteraceae bacterium]|nr:hypothetical protein [Paludibacteraceae bacterium]